LNFFFSPSCQKLSFDEFAQLQWIGGLLIIFSSTH